MKTVSFILIAFILSGFVKCNSRKNNKPLLYKNSTRYQDNKASTHLDTTKLLNELLIDYNSAVRPGELLTSNLI